MIAALYVETGGCYFGLDGVDPWDEQRDARGYYGPHPVVAHPPCQRWGRFWHGSTRKPHQFKLGHDHGTFAAALYAVAMNGGVIEHPADSHAWAHFHVAPPKRFGGWMPTTQPARSVWDDERGNIVTSSARLPGDWWTCYVEQGHYGHMSRKPTWLLAQGVDRPELNWSRGEQRLHPVALERYGYARARRIGMTAMVGGKNKTKIRNATPLPFRDVLLSIARSAQSAAVAA